MYVFIALGVIVFIFGMISNKEINIKIASTKRKPIFEPKNKTESHQNIILVGIIVFTILSITYMTISYMADKIVKNQGNKYQNTKTSRGEKRNVGDVDQGENINKFLADARQKENEKMLQEQKNNGDLVDGYLEHEGKQKILKIGKNNMVINIDESGNLKSYAEEITAGCDNDEWCEKSRFFEFIKKIPYQTDQEGGWKYNMKPIEVLNYNKGDCDERSFTLTSLLLQKKYKAVIVYAKKHAFVCMHIENKRNIYPHHAKLRINGLDYYYAETTDANAYIGSYNKVNPKDFIGVYDANKKRLIPKKEIEFYQG